jgi:hypothetical protein
MAARDFYREWADCHRDALAYARSMNLDVALRAVKEYGRKGFVFHLASRNDSDYARAEIVRPTDF